MFLFLYLIVGLLDLLVDFRSQIFFYFHSLHFKKKILLLLKLFKFLPNIRINKVSDIFTVVNLWYNIIFPLLWNYIMLLKRNTENPSTTLFFLILSDSFLFLNPFAQIYLNRKSLDVVSLLWLGYVHTIYVILLSFYNFSFRLGKFYIEN